MKVSELWLREWVNPKLTTAELASQLTMAGLEVDSIAPVSGSFDKVIVAEVLKTKPHPKADRLTLCEVSTGEDQLLQVVCGANNVRSGLKVALAQMGAQLPNGLIIKETTLRGELSQGMLCSVSELGMSDHSEGILELDSKAPIGISIRDYLMLDDNIIEVDLTPNRADCLSVLGIAREVAALNALALNIPEKVTHNPQIDDVISIKVEDPHACPNYNGRIIRNINPHALTPLWLAERLRRGGIRLVNPVVDICNYVMLELGQPLHAFDKKTIDEQVIIRFAKLNEKCILLDGQEISLKENTLVIADKTKILALAGIMGGESSAVQQDTQDIFLESAYFNALSIAGVARSYGLHTDASQRFERGVDPHLSQKALERATELLLQIVGGQVGPIITTVEPKYLPENESIEFNINLVKKLTGVSIAASEIKNILVRLGMEVEKQSAEKLRVKAPSYRYDLKLAVDLVEEIIRVYGYDNIQVESGNSCLQLGKLSPRETTVKQFTQWFSHRGYYEIISYSFVDPRIQQILHPEIETMELVNPISSELAQMRVSLWPGLIAAMVHNIHRQQSTVKLFETGIIFDIQAGKLTERPRIAGLMTGMKGSLHWSEKESALDFFDMKGDLEALKSQFKIDAFDFVKDTHPSLHPGQSARITVDNKNIGWIGVLHPRIADDLGVSQDILLFEIDLEAVISSHVQYKTLSKYPQIRRDLSFLVDNEVSAAEIEKAVRKAANPHWLKSFTIFDLYIGKGVPEGQKSLAITFTLQNPEKTLIDMEINSEISAIIKELEKFSITLRE